MLKMDYFWNPVYRSVVVGEIVSCFIFVVLTGLAIIAGKDDLFFIAIATGLTEIVCMMLFGYITGSHINPLVTALGFFLNYIECNHMFVQFLAQAIGHVLGYSFLGFCYPTFIDGISEIIESKPRVISMQNALVIEIFLSILLVLTWSGLWDKRGAHTASSNILRLGSILSLLTFLGIKFTGASLDPFKTFAICLFHQDFENFWAFVAAQVLGFMIGQMIWRKMLAPACITFPRCLSLNELIVPRRRRMVQLVHGVF